jgi:hypothetical protein
MLVGVADAGRASTTLTFTLLLSSADSKFVPVMLIVSPGAATEGVKPAIVGAPFELATVNGLALVTEPPGEPTPIGPVVAPDGTLVTIWLGLDEITVAAVPLKVTVFWLTVALNPVP